MKNQIDFLVIGAQKSGTTTLFELLKQHPSVSIPTLKEVPFFGKDEMEQKGWAWYLNEYFGRADQTTIWGTITPQYMCWPNIASKIYSINPDIKIIAILRDPFERAYSHYQMSKRRNYDSRTFYAAMKELSTDVELSNARSHVTEINSYIVRGEYGRILSEYKRVFSLENILILFTDDLEADAENTIQQIFSFLDVNDILLQGLGRKYHKGNSKPKLKWINDIFFLIKSSKRSKSLLNKIMSRKMIHTLWYKIDQWNIQNTLDTDNYERSKNIDEVKELLHEIYKKDAMLFYNEFGIKYPWHDKWQF